MLGAALVALLLSGLAYWSGGEVFIVRNLSDMEIELYSDIFEGGEVILPNSEREVTVRRFRGSVNFWYLDAQTGKLVDGMRTGRAVGPEGEPLWVERSILTINSVGDFSFLVSEVDFP